MSTVTLTLEVPDDVAAVLQIPANRAEAVALLTARFATASISDQDEEIDEEAVAALAKAIEEAKTDPGLPMDKAFEEIRTRFLARPRQPAA